MQKWATDNELTAAVVIDSNFADEDSFIYFGRDPLIELRNVIGGDVSVLPNQWALNLAAVTIDADNYTDFSIATALLESSY